MSRFPFEQIEQPSKGYRYSIDSLLLARFAHFHSNDQVCDLGTGVGIIAILAAAWGKVKEVKAVEVQKELAHFARLNIQKLNLEKQIEVVESNWKNLSKIFKSSSFDVVISNPPYRKKETGRICPDSTKSIARHEILGSMSDLVKMANYLLKKNGRLYLIYPPLRLEELIACIQMNRFKIQRMAFIHPFIDRSASQVMVEIVRSVKGEIEVERPIVIYKDLESYQPEIETWIGKKSKIRPS